MGFTYSGVPRQCPLCSHHCPRCINVLALTCKSVHRWFYCTFDEKIDEREEGEQGEGGEELQEPELEIEAIYFIADAFGAHKTDAIRRLCCQRGYIPILHPGGTTPFAQTCDTDLHQHVRRDYIALEVRGSIEMP